MPDTLTQRKKAAKVVLKQPLTSVSVLSKYEAKPPTGRCAISWDAINEVFLFEPREGQTLSIPATAAGAEQIRSILRAQALARDSGAIPRVGSEAYPTQFDINAWMKVKSNREAADTHRNEELARHDAEDTSKGF